MGFTQILNQTKDIAEVITSSSYFSEDMKSIQSRVNAFISSDIERLSNLALKCKKYLDTGFVNIEDAVKLITSTPPEVGNIKSIMLEVDNSMKTLMPEIDEHRKLLEEFREFISNSSLYMKKAVIDLNHNIELLNFKIMTIKSAMNAEVKKGNGAGSVFTFFKSLFGLGSTFNMVQDELYQNLKIELGKQEDEIVKNTSDLDFYSKSSDQLVKLDSSLQLLTSALNAFIADLYSIEHTIDGRLNIPTGVEDLLVVGIYLDVTSKQFKDALVLL